MTLFYFKYPFVIMPPNSFLVSGGITQLSGARFPIGGEGTWTAALLANRRPIPLSSPSYSIRIPFTLILLVLEKYYFPSEVLFYACVFLRFRRADHILVSGQGTRTVNLKGFFIFQEEAT
jgi:hypothetical protein